MGDMTDLIRRSNGGDEEARRALFVAAYGELRQLAHRRLYHDGGRNTYLDTTALVHESFLRLVDMDRLRQEDHRAFFAYASKVMRSVIVDAARERQAERRGGHVVQLTLNTDLIEGLPGAEGLILEVHEALEVLEQANPRRAKIVEMRYFGGYTDIEIAEALGTTDRTIRREWRDARALLLTVLNGVQPDPQASDGDDG